ncbi:hypothetical protein N9M53_04515 [Alphaproteobacteria bacterium]|jgi:hypothetical protein|nr:hypothetical protein [Alphaproteobacteria bacterium]MDG2465698.1 hypothetical protein [Alphaproteobacteria bacterium]
MRFLIFNISVLAALGYLFTASPDQSFSSWITGTSKTVVAQIDDVMRDGKDTIEQSPVSLSSPVDNDMTMLRDEIKGLKSDIADLNAHINHLNRNVISDQMPAPDSVNVDARMEAASYDTVNMPDHVAAPVPSVELNMTPAANSLADATNTDDMPVSDADIADAFQAISVADQNNQIAPSLDPATPAMDLQYMSPYERIDDLGKLMIDMQVFYLEHSGV